MTINLKALPQNNEAEQAVLGSILIDQDAMNLALEEIVESDFYDENHKKIFSAMVDLDKESKPIDILTLYDKLKSKKSLLKDVGGSSYLSQLIEIVPSSSNVVFYAKSVKEKSILRSMIRTASEIIDEGQTAEVEVDEFVDQAEEIALQRVKKLYNCKYANLQPHSGAQANQAVFLALLKPNDTFLGMSLASGGHLTHGAKPNISGKWFNAIQYGVNKEGNEKDLINYDEVETLAKLVLTTPGCKQLTVDLDFISLL